MSKQSTKPSQPTPNNSTAKKVLIVGCGAVGQVYGLSLQKAGVELGYLDRPTTVEALKAGTRTRRIAPLPSFVFA